MHPGCQPKEAAPPPSGSVWEAERQHVAFLSLVEGGESRGCCTQVDLMNMVTSCESGQCSGEVEEPGRS